jgi:hypothetical protein
MKGVTNIALAENFGEPRLLDKPFLFKSLRCPTTQTQCARRSGKPRPTSGHSIFHFRVVPQRSGWSGGGKRRSLYFAPHRNRTPERVRKQRGGRGDRPITFVKDKL